MSTNPQKKRPGATSERPPHPATVVLPKPAPKGIAARPPHPATVAQPKARHPATVARSRPHVAQRMIQQTDVTGWTTFTPFRNYVRDHPKRDDETWDAYELRIAGELANFPQNQKQADHLANAIRPHRTRAEQAERDRAVRQAPKKPTLWSRAYTWNGRRWNAASHSVNKRDARTTTNDHAEQELFSTMTLPKKGSVWIGFVQNEYPCVNDGCCDYFRGVSRRDDVDGVVFNVQDSGSYAQDHGFQRGASGPVYFVDGGMVYVRPDGAPPPPT